MDNLERSGCAVLLTTIAIVVYGVCLCALFGLVTNDQAGGGIGSLARLFLTFGGCTVGVALSTLLTIVAGMFRKRSLWMLVLQLPALGFFMWFWLNG
jgi:hypothetical protein